MRSFDERMDEIRSRSKARIAHRRKMITAVCTPLVLCLVISGIWLIPYGNAEPVSQTVPGTTGFTGSVTVAYNEGDIILTSADVVTNIELFIAGLKPVDPTREHSIKIGTTASEIPSMEAPVLTMDACIFFEIVNAEGNTFSYRLTQRTLSCDETGVMYELNYTQYHKLLELLGIGEP